MSFSMIERGAVQYGFKITSWIFEFKIGVHYYNRSSFSLYVFKFGNTPVQNTILCNLFVSCNIFTGFKNLISIDESRISIENRFSKCT